MSNCDRHIYICRYNISGIVCVTVSRVILMLRVHMPYTGNHIMGVASLFTLFLGEKGEGKTTYKPLHYKGTPIHRVVKGFIIQGGDFANGMNRKCIGHARACGVVCMLVFQVMVVVVNLFMAGFLKVRMRACLYAVFEGLPCFQMRISSCITRGHSCYQWPIEDRIPMVPSSLCEY